MQSVVVRFVGDSGDGMQLTGNLFSSLSAILGDEISTFPDFPAEIRAPQGTLGGVSGFQVHLGKGVYTPGDKADVLVAMNAAALKVNVHNIHDHSIIICDTDSFTAKDLEKALYKTDNPFQELGFPETVQIVPVALTSLTKESLKDSGMDLKAIVRSKNMFALGLVCWLFDRPIEHAISFLEDKFKKKPALIAPNVKVLTDGYNYGQNLALSVNQIRVEAAQQTGNPGARHTSIAGNKATAWGLIAAAERAGKQLFLGSYPITPATDILHELSQRKDCGVVTVQAEDEISGVCTALGAAFAGALAVTSTSGPGICLKSEAMNMAVIDELPLVIIDVQRGGPSTGLPTKSEQTDLLQALYGRNGESPMPVIAATSPTDCFDAAYQASKMALEHLTPVILLTDAFIANGSAAWKLPTMDTLPTIAPHYVTPEMKGNYTPYQRDEETMVRYWAIPRQEGYTHILGGLEKDGKTGAISTEPENHDIMCRLRAEKVARIPVPDLEVEGDKEDAELLIVGFGSTYGHLYSAMEELQKEGHKVALAQLKFINPLPKNTAEVMKKYKKVVVAEQNLGQLAAYLRAKVDGFAPYQFNQVKGQPFVVSELNKAFAAIINA